MTESAMPATDTTSLTLILALAAALILLAIEPVTHKPSRPRPAPAPKNGAAANHLMGQVTRAQLAAHSGWGQLDGRDYAPDAATLARLKDYGEDVRVAYLDVDDAALSDYPVLEEAVKSNRRLPLVLVGDEIKTPWSLSFSWIVNELKGLGVVE